MLKTLERWISASILLSLIMTSFLFSQYAPINYSYDYSFRQIDGSVVNIDSLNLPVFTENDTVTITFTHTGIDSGINEWFPSNFVRFDTTIINAGYLWVGDIFYFTFPLKIPFGNWQLRVRTNGANGERTDYSNRSGFIVATRNPQVIFELMIKLKIKL